MAPSEIKQRAMQLAESGTTSEADVRALAYLVAKLTEQLTPAIPEKTP